MAVLVVLQSRLSSARLPAKALLSIAGMPVVVLAARRAANTGLATVIATSDHSDDDVLAAAVSSAGLDVVRGPLDDPLARFLVATADLADTDVVVRLTADNVFPDGALIDYAAARVNRETPYVRIGGDADLPLPYGVSVEAFTVAALRRAGAEAESAFEREHVTPWIRTAYGDVQISPPMTDDRWRGLRATVDTFDDYVRVSRALGSSSDPTGAPWTSLAELLARTTPRPLPVATDPPTNRLHQSRLVLGTAQLGLDYGAANSGGLPTEDATQRVLHEATASGISHLDTARAYGMSERRIGGSLRRGLSEHLSVVTKIRPLDDLPEIADPRWGTAAAESSIAESLHALGVDTVAVLLTHRAKDWHKPGVRAALVHARETGRAAAIGVSLGTPEELLDLVDDTDLDYVQVPFNLLDRRWLAPDVQRALHERPDLIVTVRSVYLQGLLAAGLEARWPASSAEIAPSLVAALDSVVETLRRRSRADLALAYVLGQPWVTSVVIGAESLEQVRDTAELSRLAPLTADERALVERVVPAGPDDLIDPSRW